MSRLGIGLLAAYLVLFAGVAHAQWDPNKSYRLTTEWQGYGKSLDVNTVQSLSDPNQYTYTPFLGATNVLTTQMWKITPLGNGFYRLNGGTSSQVSLDILNDGKTPTLKAPSNVTGQMWKITPLGNGFYRLTTQSQGDGKSLDIVNDGTNNKLTLAATGNFTGQNWRIVEWSDPTVSKIGTPQEVVPGAYYRIGDIAALSSTPGQGTGVTHFMWGATDTQKWKFTYLSNGYYHLSTLADGDSKVLDIDAQSGNAILAASSSTSNSQMWKVTPTGNGSFRLTTLALGDGKALDVNPTATSVNYGAFSYAPQYFQARMAATGNVSTQSWNLWKVVDAGAAPLAQQASGNLALGTSFCWTDSYGRGVGTIPTTCGPGEQYDAGLCYRACKPGYHSAGPACWPDCPSDFPEAGLACSKPKPYGRGAGYPWQFGDGLDLDAARHRCEDVYHYPNCEDWGAVCYPKCKANFHNVGCCICSPDCPGGTVDIEILCVKQGDWRGVGTIPTTCPAGQEYDAGLCYPKCKDTYSGVGPVCWGGGPNVTPAWVYCAAGFARSAGECGSAIESQVYATIEATVSTGILIASCGASTATKAKELSTADKAVEEVAKHWAQVSAGMVVEQGKQAIVDKYGTETANVSIDYAWDISKLTDPKEMNKLSEAEKQHAIARVSLHAISLADPSGVTGMVASYTRPLCSQIGVPAAGLAALAPGAGGSLKQVAANADAIQNQLKTNMDLANKANSDLAAAIAKANTGVVIPNAPDLQKTKFETQQRYDDATKLYNAFSQKKPALLASVAKPRQPRMRPANPFDVNNGGATQ